MNANPPNTRKDEKGGEGVGTNGPGKHIKTGQAKDTGEGKENQDELGDSKIPVERVRGNVELMQVEASDDCRTPERGLAEVTVCM